MRGLAAVALVSLSLAFVPAPAFCACVPAREFVKFPHQGHYHRVHPSGNYVLFTGSGAVKIADLTDRKSPKELNTPMANESYPVEGAGGGWDLISSPFDRGYMRYYQTKDLLAERQFAQDVYRDAEHNEYYHSVAELPGSTVGVRKVRTLLYGRMYREYTMKKDSAGNFTQVQAGPAQQEACRDFLGIERPAAIALNPADAARAAELKSSKERIEEQLRPLGNRIYAIDVAMRDAEGIRRQNLFEEKRNLQDQVYQLTTRREPLVLEMAKLRYGSRYGGIKERLQELENAPYPGSAAASAQKARETERLAKEVRELEDLVDGAPENLFANPVLSKDGTLVAAAGSNRIGIFRILEGGKCEKVMETKYSGAKVSFSYPEAGKLPKITFTANAGPSGRNGNAAYVLDLNSKKTIALSQNGEVTHYPGFTKDGRVIYSTKSGFTIVDPNQIAGNNQACIQKSASSTGSNYEADADEPTTETSGAAQ